MMFCRRKLVVFLTLGCLFLLLLSANHYIGGSSSNETAGTGDKIQQLHNSNHPVKGESPIQSEIITEDPNQEISNAIRKHAESNYRHGVEFKKPAKSAVIVEKKSKQFGKLNISIVKQD
jgi:hypothetical protein